MAMTDPLGDMLTRIRNGQLSGKVEVAAPASRIKLALAKVLKDEGYIEDFAVDGDSTKPTVKVRTGMLVSFDIRATLADESTPPDMATTMRIW